MFQMTERQGLIVYINNFHVLRRLRRYGHIVYVSKRMRYVVLYVNRSLVEELKKKLEKLHSVTSVKPSEWPNIDPTVFRLSDVENANNQNNEE
ncbi:YlbG family protein [Limosilactobacillus coleohominis]|uniref:YlbG family protein n=1 Tax=Limosilactobacillus coleohominis TaxID=181675 RepID=UPI00195ED471|nr:YlbG family protein [Limosilactobacillus coleohominis]MBM6954247.1 YlbG family protein [Limosilactobacillus coleohominis]